MSDSQTPNQQPPATTPEPTPEPKKWAGKFDSPDALEKAYKELETKLGAPKGEPKANNPLQINPNAPAALNDDADLAAVAKSAGLDPDELGRRFASDERLTDEQYAALKSKGFPRKLVDEHLSLLRERAAATSAAIREGVDRLTGGEQQTATLMQFAATLPQERIDDLNRRLANPALYEGAIAEIMSAHQQAVGSGKAKPLAQGGAGSAMATGRFNTPEEIGAAMRDERYAPSLPGGVPNPKHDPAYYQSVNTRLAATPMM